MNVYLDDSILRTYTDISQFFVTFMTMPHKMTMGCLADLDSRMTILLRKSTSLSSSSSYNGPNWKNSVFDLKANSINIEFPFEKMENAKEKILEEEKNENLA